MPADLTGWLQYIEALHPKSISMGLDRVIKVKNRLGLNPNFPIIMVGGTNGKGSTCAMLESIYHQAGYQVAAYSSPHLLRYNERVRINAQEVSDEMLIDAFRAVELARRDMQLTYFEFGTLAAIWCFMQQNVEIGVLEVGLGGRLDAVNVFEPDCTIVTAIDIDHIDFLGDSRESIGYEKAGIFRNHIAAICGDLNPPMTLINRALEVGAHLLLLNRDFSVIRHHDAWDFESDMPIRDLPLPALVGDFQLQNAACAISAVEVMQASLPIDRTHLVAGLTQVKLAGRFQIVGQAPTIILDVTHNPHAAEALAHNLRQNPISGKTIAVFAMLADKDIQGVIQAVMSQIDTWYLSSVEHVRAASKAQLVEIFNKTNVAHETRYFDDLASAFDQACLVASKTDRIIVFGSFFTVAEVMRILAMPTTQ
jgi:dihydrofolate synthase / folylpolyglutamate synthase